MVLSQYLNENLIDVKEMDEIVCAVDKLHTKCVIFTGIDIDALSFKRKNYKNDLENFKKFLVDSSMIEKEIYDEIIKLVNFIFIFFSKMNKLRVQKMKMHQIRIRIISIY